MRSRTYSLLALLVVGVPSVAPAALVAPTNLRATVAGSGIIDVAWTDRSVREIGFEVERSVLPTTGFVLLATTPKNATTLRDGGLAPGTYYYRVRAVGRRARSASRYSNVASAVIQVVTPAVDSEPPSTPVGLSASSTSCTRSHLAWVASADRGGSGLAGYRIYRNGLRTAEVGAATLSADETGLTPQAVYVYAVSAIDGAGNESGASTPAVVTMPLCPNLLPVAQAGPDQLVSAGASVSFSGAASTDADGSVVAFAWAFGDGGTANGVAVTHAYATPGTYAATLTVTDNQGGKSTDTALVNVNATAAMPWSRSAGSPGDDRALGVAVDGTGNVAVTGYFSGTVDFGGGPLTSDHIATLDPNNYRDAFVARYSATGTPLWSRRLGADADDRGNAVAVDGTGNVIVAGAVENYVDFGDGVVTGTEGGFDAFVAKYAAGDGHHLWSRRFGTSGIEGAYGVASDVAGNVLAIGDFENTISPAGTALTSAGGLDVFVVKYGPTGTPLWSRRFGGSAFDYGYGAALDASGNAIVTGAFYGTVDFGGGPLTSAGGLDVFVAKYGPTGAHLWSKRFGGTADDVGYGVAVDASGSVLVTGAFQGTAAFGGATLASAGDTDAFVTKLSAAAGALVWAKRFGAAAQDRGQGLAVDGSGNLAVTGYFQGSVDFGGGPLASTAIDVFVARFSSAGAHLWSRRFGTTGSQFPGGVAMSPSSRTLIAGYYQYSIDLGDGPHPSAGGYDAFLADVGP